MPNQQNLLYTAILALAIALTAIAITSLSAVRLQPPSQAPVEPFSLQKKEEDLYITHRLEDLQSALEKHDNTKTFVVQHRLLESPSQALLRKYEQCENPSEKYILLQTLSMKASPKEADFFRDVYRKSNTIAFQRTALLGVLAKPWGDIESEAAAEAFSSGDLKKTQEIFVANFIPFKAVEWVTHGGMVRQSLRTTTNFPTPERPINNNKIRSPLQFQDLSEIFILLPSNLQVPNIRDSTITLFGQEEIMMDITETIQEIQKKPAYVKPYKKENLP